MLGCAGTSSSSEAHGAPDSQLESELLELEEELELESTSIPPSASTACGACGLASGARRRSKSSGTCHSGPRFRFFGGVLGAWLRHATTLFEGPPDPFSMTWKKDLVFSKFIKFATLHGHALVYPRSPEPFF